MIWRWFLKYHFFFSRIHLKKTSYWQFLGSADSHCLRILSKNASKIHCLCWQLALLPSHEGLSSAPARSSVLNCQAFTCDVLGLTLGLSNPKGLKDQPSLTVAVAYVYWVIILPAAWAQVSHSLVWNKTHLYFEGILHQIPWFCHKRREREVLSDSHCLRTESSFMWYK